MIKLISDKQEKQKISSYILSELPDWFGLPESVRDYVAMSADMPFWAAYTDGSPIGFVSMKETSKDTAEIFVMGVLEKYHRSGTGRALYHELEMYAKDCGFSFVQVKTVQMGHYDVYDRTNLFYLSLGFRELECFPNLWEPSNPCQIYVKYIGETDCHTSVRTGSQ